MNESKKEKFIKDLKNVMNTIDRHNDRDWINNAFIKGPPINSNFKYCKFEGGTTKHWTIKEANGIRDIANLILELGYKSDSYGLFLKVVQHRIKKSFMDNEGKWDGDIRNGFFYES